EAVIVGILSRDDRGASGEGPADRRVAVLEESAGRNSPIEERARGPRVAVRRQMVRAKIVDDDEDDVVWVRAGLGRVGQVESGWLGRVGGHAGLGGRLGGV